MPHGPYIGKLPAAFGSFGSQKDGIAGDPRSLGSTLVGGGKRDGSTFVAQMITYQPWLWWQLNDVGGSVVDSGSTALYNSTANGPPHGVTWPVGVTHSVGPGATTDTRGYASWPVGGTSGPTSLLNYSFPANNNAVPFDASTNTQIMVWAKYTVNTNGLSIYEADCFNGFTRLDVIAGVATLRVGNGFSAFEGTIPLANAAGTGWHLYCVDYGIAGAGQNGDTIINAWVDGAQVVTNQTISGSGNSPTRSPIKAFGIPTVNLGGGKDMAVQDAAIFGSFRLLSSGDLANLYNGR